MLEWHKNFAKGGLGGMSALSSRQQLEWSGVKGGSSSKTLCGRLEMQAQAYLHSLGWQEQHRPIGSAALTSTHGRLAAILLTLLLALQRLGR